MSTQDTGGVPFEVSTDPKNIRLLELPPSLLELIRSNNPPNLMLKSTTIRDDVSQQSPAYAVLCTDDQTFQVRQVQSSNSVFVLQSMEKPLPSGGTNLPMTSLCAIAQCPSLLELVPTSISSIAFLRQKLQAFNGERSDGFPPMISVDKLESWDPNSKYGILEDAPFSNREFDQAWGEICAFEHAAESWIPTASVLTNVWGAIVMAASARDLKLDESFSTSAIVSTVDEESYPTALVSAVLARISARDQDVMDGYAILDRTKCVSWVGAVLLESLDGEVLVSDFVKQWQDKLPEAWRDRAFLEAIKGKYSQPSSAVIVYNEKEPTGDRTASKAPKAATAKVRPNWHEKFKNTKR